MAGLPRDERRRTPAAGGSDGAQPASDAVMTPPLDFVESTGAPMPSPRRPRSRSSKYTDIRCPTYAFITATNARSYSRICGHSSADTDTKSCGARASITRRVASSFAGFL